MIEKAVYDLKLGLRDKDKHQIEGRLVYECINQAIILTEQMRQHDPTQQRFREVLDHVADGGFTMEDWKFLETRNYQYLSEHEKQVFQKEAVKLCAYNKDFIKFNIKKCEETGNPIAMITAENRPPGAKATKANDAGSLINNLILSVGQKIVLKKNLWSDAGMFCSRLLHQFALQKVHAHCLHLSSRIDQW